MIIDLDLHRDPPESPKAARRSFVEADVRGVEKTKDEAGVFLREALDKVSKGIKPGEQRAVGVGIYITG